MKTGSPQRNFLLGSYRAGVLLLAFVLITMMSWCPVSSTPTAKAAGGYVLADGHADIFYAIAGGGNLGLALKEDVSGSEVLHFPEDVTLAVGDNAYSQDVAEVPEIGVPGYYLPQTQQPGILWPGWSTQQVASEGLGQVDFSFDSVTGPGNVFLFSQRGLGDLGPVLSDGSFQLQTGSVLTQAHPAHVHANWVFTEAGTYEMRVTAHSGGLSSNTRTYVWQVGGNPTSTIANDSLQYSDFLQDSSTSSVPAEPAANQEVEQDQAAYQPPAPDAPEANPVADPETASKPDTDTPPPLEAAPPLLQDQESGQFQNLPAEHLEAQSVVEDSLPQEANAPKNVPQSAPAGGFAQSKADDVGSHPSGSRSDVAAQAPSTKTISKSDPQGTTPSGRQSSPSTRGNTSAPSRGSAQAQSQTARVAQLPAQKAADNEMCAALSPLIKDDREQPAQWRTPDEIAFGLGESATVDLPRSLGPVQQGSAWMIGATQQDGVPWVGANTQHPTIREHIDGGVTWKLSQFEGPGAMFVYEQGNLGKIVGKEWFQGEGTKAEGSVEINENTHVHPNWVFSQPGTYRVTITQTAKQKNGGEVSGEGTITFHVGETMEGDATEGHFDIGAQWSKKPCSPSQTAPGDTSQDAENQPENPSADDHTSEESEENANENQDGQESSSQVGSEDESTTSPTSSRVSQARIAATSQQQGTGVTWQSILIAVLGVAIGVLGAVCYFVSSKEQQ